MKMMFLLVVGLAAGFGYWIWTASRRLEARRRAAEDRFAAFVAQSMKPGAPKTDAAPAASPAATPQTAPAADLAPQRLLFEAAAKASEAGEPALSIQLYARLIARYPNGALVAQARAAVEQQKSKLARR